MRPERFYYKRFLAATALILTVAAIAGVLHWMRGRLPNANTKAQIGKSLPPGIFVYDRLGHRVDLAKIDAGRARVFAFYSPSCGVCQRELPQLDPFPGNLLLIKIDENGTAPGSHEGNAPYVDRDHVLSRSVSLAALPTLLFVDEDGVLRDGLIGEHGLGVTQKRLQAFARGRSS